MNFYRKSFDVAGYTYKAATYCPACMIAALPTGEGQKFDGWKIDPSLYVSPEDNLTELAAAFGIDRMDERSFDSDDFPKVIFVDQTEDYPCDICGGEL